jgi:nicotinate-nucleotide pyrophosphorylase (carboxylating)
MLLVLQMHAHVSQHKASFRMTGEDHLSQRITFPEEYIKHLIDLALAEDIATGDVTTEILLPATLQSRAIFMAKDDGVLAGIDIACLVFIRTDPTLEIDVRIQDGTTLKNGDVIAEIKGKTRSIVTAERVALNFLQKLSGIASQTAKFVALTHDLPVAIVDTRKTTPGFRLLEKYAVRMGGGRNHRLNLSDMILIKDNHLAALRAQGMSLKEIVTLAKEKAPEGLKVEVETTNLEEVQEAVEAGANIIMFDNMSPVEMQRAVKLLPEGTISEASGGVTLENVRAIAETGVSMISIGALTHSSKALDISLELLV